LARSVVGLVDALEGRRADGTALAGMFSPQEPLVDLRSALDELGQVLDSCPEVEVGRFVDDGLDAKGPPFFQVLLHP
jgi:hypothetical protein